KKKKLCMCKGQTQNNWQLKREIRISNDWFLWQLKDCVRKELDINTGEVILGMYRRCNNRNSDFTFHVFPNKHCKLRHYHIHDNDTVRVRIEPSKGNMLGFKRLSGAGKHKRDTSSSQVKVPWATTLSSTHTHAIDTTANATSMITTTTTAGNSIDTSTITITQSKRKESVKNNLLKEKHVSRSVAGSNSDDGFVFLHESDENSNEN
ncbi:hypothetical protein RFI_33335, partial [Reticulomyxa filosa]